MSSNDNSYASVGSDRSASASSPSPSMLLLLHSSAPSPQIKSGAKRMKLSEETAVELSVDEMAIIFSFLPPKAIMLARVCTTWRDAAKKTIPRCDFKVNSVRSYNAMRAMSTALPNLQCISINIYDLSYHEDHKYPDGEDPDEELAECTADYDTHDINVISNFSKLCHLHIESPGYSLNGRYPTLFNFPFLQSLTIITEDDISLKWDLEMLSGLPLLEDIHCSYFSHNNSYPTGNLSSLRVLKNTLERVYLFCCYSIRGNFMELADFPHLKELNLQCTAVTGDIRDIRTDEFPVMEELKLPETVIGGIDYEFQRISDVPVFMETIYPLLKRTPLLLDEWTCRDDDCCWHLSWNSPDRYDGVRGHAKPPLSLQIIEAGPRIGWRWCTPKKLLYYDEDNGEKHSCEVNWLDPEPRSDSNDYESYIAELQRIDLDRRVDFYRGYHQPPTEQEYRRLCEG